MSTTATLDKAYLVLTHSGSIQMAFTYHLPNGTATKFKLTTDFKCAKRNPVKKTQACGEEKTKDTGWPECDQCKLGDLNLALGEDKPEQTWDRIRHISPRDFPKFKELELLPADVSLKVVDLIEDHRKDKERNGELVRPSVYKHLTDYFGDMLVRDCTTPKIIAYRDQREDATSARGRRPASNSIRSEMNTLRAAFNKAFKDEKITKIPCNLDDNIPADKPVKRRRLIQDWEVPIILEELPERLHAIFQAAMHLSWRVGELRRLDKDQLGPDGVLRIAKTKNGDPKEFSVKSDPYLVAIFEDNEQRRRQLQRQLGHEIRPLFFGDDGKRLFEFSHTFQKAIHRLVEQHKLVVEDDEVIVFHCARHSAASALVKAMPLKVAQKITGHRSYRSLERYLHFGDDDVAEGIAASARRREELSHNVIPFKRRQVG